MITLFTISKSFLGDDDCRQRNAIRSWRAAFAGQAQVLLYGDDEGAAEATLELGCEHVRGIATNSYGTPYLDWAFRDATERAQYSVLCYVNADIIIPPTFASALTKIQCENLGQFLAIGRRYDVDIEGDLAIESVDWPAECDSLLARGTRGSEDAIDYFCFTRGLFTDLPHFLVGRPSWDNWLIGHALALDLPVIDLSEVALVIHQNHGYGHVKDSIGNKWDGPEGEENKKIIAGQGWKVGDLLDAQLALTTHGLIPNFNDEVLWRCLKRSHGQLIRLSGLKAFLARLRLIVASILMKLRSFLPGTCHRRLIMWLTR